ncbi:MAG: methylated-DNA--[protein]-cysteine S-methyltransferase [Candidatus Zixiibacteriota bacterium]|nr:MAG: methylated-DNA--[protein]-cysteine S-methyltransferase [candidate division Zixibacteria bacterium]
MRKLFTNSFNTRLGAVKTIATEKKLLLIALPGESEDEIERQTARYADGAEVLEGGEINRMAERQLTEFLNGKRREFSLPVELRGTEFQRMVLQRVQQIPYGKTMTYGEVARSIGRPSSARAVGAANAANRLPLVIPCHRVVAAHGQGGYGGGLEVKADLLQMEAENLHRK